MEIITRQDRCVNRSGVLQGHVHAASGFMPSDELARANALLQAQRAGRGSSSQLAADFQTVLNNPQSLLTPTKANSCSTQPCGNVLSHPRDNAPSSNTQPQTIVLHPALATALLKTETATSGRLWLLARGLDTQGSGVWHIDALFNTFTDKESIYRICGKKRLKQLLQAGNGLFWDRDDNNRLFLRGVGRVAVDLGVTHLSGSPVSLPISNLLGGMSSVRAALYATFHAGRKTNNPISRETLRSLLGVSPRAQRNYDKTAQVGKVQQTAVGGKWEPAAVEQARWNHRGVFKYSERNKDGSTLTRIAWRLPNQYTTDLSQAGRGGLRKLNKRLQGLVSKRAQDNCEQANSTLVEQTVFCQDASKIAKLVGSPQDVYWKEGKRWLVMGGCE